MRRFFASGESYVVSTEDPVFLSLQFPTESRIDESSVAEEIKFNYTNDGTESFEWHGNLRIVFPSYV